jgi:hypothetical protein
MGSRKITEAEHQQRIAAGEKARAAKKSIQQQRELAAKFHLEFAPVRQEAVNELLQLTGDPNLSLEVDFPLALITDCLRGFAAGFPSVQQLSSEELDELDRKDLPHFQYYVDAAADSVVKFSREYALPRNGPTDKLITRFLEGCEDFFQKHRNEDLTHSFVDLALDELNLRRLDKHTHGTKG